MHAEISRGWCTDGCNLLGTALLKTRKLAGWVTELDRQGMKQVWENVNCRI